MGHITVLAHFGHWYISLLYVAPVLIVVVALAIQSRRESGEAEEEDELEDLEPAADDDGLI